MENPLKRKKTSGIDSLKRKMLMMFGIQRVYPRASASLSAHEEGIMGSSLGYRHSYQMKTTLLEVERKKASAIMEIERQRMNKF